MMECEKGKNEMPLKSLKLQLLLRLFENAHAADKPWQQRHTSVKPSTAWVLESVLETWTSQTP